MNIPNWKLIFSFVTVVTFSLANCQIRELILGDFPTTPSNYKTINDIHYHLYTPDNVDVPLSFKVSSTRVNEALDVKVIIHGFTENSDTNWYKHMTQEYLKNRNLNVIAVDWSKRAQPPYINAVKETRIVGNAIGSFLTELDTDGKIKLSKTHIVGHSLGSHVAGFAGKWIYKTTGKKLQRITGLDPAGPLFEFAFISNDDRLSKSDAHFVDIIHTDSGILGFKSSIGDADYFPNGGNAFQPGCNLPNPNNIFEYICSHQRSHAYFIESINSDKFIAKSCDSWSSYEMDFCKSNENVLFGENASANFTGNFFLRTAPASPYSVL